MQKNDSTKQATPSKEQPNPRPNHNQSRPSNDEQSKKVHQKRELNMDTKPTPSSDLKSRLDYSTRVPTVFDDFINDEILENNRDRNYQRQNSAGQNRSHQQHSNQYPHQAQNQHHRRNQNLEKKFDRPFDKNEKCDIVITTNFQSATRQVSLNQPNTFNTPRQYAQNFNNTNTNTWQQNTERRSNQNRQETYQQYAQSNQRGGGNQRRNFNPQPQYQQHQQPAYDDNNFRQYMPYVDNAADLGNYAEGGDFSHVRTQTFNNRNFGNFDENAYASGSGTHKHHARPNYPRTNQN
jgi:hypothetical protein